MQPEDATGLLASTVGGFVMCRTAARSRPAQGAALGSLGDFSAAVCTAGAYTAFVLTTLHHVHRQLASQHAAFAGHTDDVQFKMAVLVPTTHSHTHMQLYSYGPLVILKRAVPVDDLLAT